jgi:hypothetical protein
MNVTPLPQAAPPQTRQLTANQLKKVESLFNDFFIERVGFLERWQMFMTTFLYLRLSDTVNNANIIQEDKAVLMVIFELNELIKILTENEKKDPF